MRQLSGLDVPADQSRHILTALGFHLDGHKATPPTWRRDVDGKADLVEEVARIVGYHALPSTPLPEVSAQPGGILTARHSRARAARRDGEARQFGRIVVALVIAGLAVLAYALVIFLPAIDFFMAISEASASR